MVDPVTTTTAITVGTKLVDIIDRHSVEDERFENQMKIEKYRLAEQKQLEFVKQKINLVVKETERQHQWDLTQWKAQFDETIWLKKQIFDKKEVKKNRKLQRELVEKKIAADENLQKFLNKSHQEFQAKLEAIRRDTQLTIAEFTKQVDMAIAEDNRQFQAYLFSEQRQLQQELAEYNRETQLQVVKQQKEVARDRIIHEEIMKG